MMLGMRATREGGVEIDYRLFGNNKLAAGIRGIRPMLAGVRARGYFDVRKAVKMYVHYIVHSNMLAAALHHSTDLAKERDNPVVVVYSDIAFSLHSSNK
ncbi:hypothetical protein NDU88_002814 [Pleurodeles waltl]|uniref:Uncharacterized protein n=1 Tax=Pleurodeles waltl TaxID=8319 RepID=A0AAV7KWH8_PLEWA|nr:hypothetical protein NDU88_002814 [Pleurodeles waltl]